MSRSQRDRILDYLATGRSLSPLVALDRFGCFRLGARVHELRQAGHDIRAKLVKFGGKRYASYSLCRNP
jgi:hypothetical protein